MHSFLLSIFGFLTSISGHADQQTLQCTIQKNYEVVWKGSVAAEDNSKLQVSKSVDYTFYVTGRRGAKLELEVFFPDLEARTYAEGTLAQDGVKLTQWTRDSILEFNCRK